MVAKVRVSLDRNHVPVGEPVEVKTIVTGLAAGGGNPGGKGLVGSIRCTVAGKEVFRGRLGASMSAIPYIQFQFVARESGMVTVLWTTVDGVVLNGEQPLQVS